jgi:hypothetical protein
MTYVALPLVTESVGGDFVTHALVHEDAKLAVIFDVVELLRPVGRVGDVELHLDVYECRLSRHSCLDRFRSRVEEVKMNLLVVVPEVLKIQAQFRDCGFLLAGLGTASPPSPLIVPLQGVRTILLARISSHAQYAFRNQVSCLNGHSAVTATTWFYFTIYEVGKLKVMLLRLGFLLKPLETWYSTSITPRVTASSSTGIELHPSSCLCLCGFETSCAYTFLVEPADLTQR